MTHDAALQLIAEQEDENLLDLLSEVVPEESDDFGRSVGDPVVVLPYADAEICNGGFFQFYANGIFDPFEIAGSFELIEFGEMAEIVRQSIAVFPEGVPPIREHEDPDQMIVRLKGLGIKNKSFNEIDGRYFELTGQLGMHLVAHVRRNADVYARYLVDASSD